MLESEHNLDAIDAYPLEWPPGWPRTKNPVRSKFHTKTGRYQKRAKLIGEGRDFLLEELDRLEATNIIISSNLPVRNDGMPYANATNPDDPGVVAYFLLDGEARAIPCDKWDRAADNLYAIGKTIEAMRGIDRWGTPQIIAAAFKGFKALPAAGTGFKWWKVLDVEPDARVEEIKKGFKAKAKLYHPDVAAGAEATRKFREVQEAYKQGLQVAGS